MKPNQDKEYRDKISKILVKWSMPTRQIAINEILEELQSAYARGREDIFKVLEDPEGEFYIYDWLTIKDVKRFKELSNLNQKEND